MKNTIISIPLSILQFKRQAILISLATLLVVFSVVVFGVMSEFRFKAVDDAWSVNNQRVSNISNAMSNLSLNIGYGGFIHNFTNLVLRRDIPHYQPAIEKNIAGFTADLDRLDALLALPEDKAAVAQIRSTFAEYTDKYQLIAPMIRAGKSSSEIDDVIKVSDTAALMAKIHLIARIRERAIEAERNAQTTQRDAILFLLVGGIIIIVAIMFMAAVLVLFLRRLTDTHELLRQSSLEIQDLYDNAPCGYHSLNKEGVICQINNTELDWLGYSKDEVIGKMKWGDLISAKCRQTFWDNFSQFLKQGFIHDLEFEMIRKDGTVFTGLLNAAAVYDPSGDYLISRSTLSDITQRKKTEDELRISAVTFEAYDAVMITDAAGNIIKVNQAFTKVSGFSAEDIVGQNPRIMNSGLHDKAFFAQVFQQVLSDGSWEGDIWDKRKNGEIYPRSMTITAIKDERQITTHYVAIFRDITERIKAQEVLRKAEQSFRFILENSPIAVRVASKATGRVVFANRNYCKLIGGSIEQAIGVNPKQYYANPMEYEEIVDQLNKGESVSNKLVKLSHQNEIKWALASFMLANFENEPSYLGWFYDISDRKRLEEQVENLAFYDPLTALPNRRLLNDRLGLAMATNKRHGMYGALMFMDLDKFKPLNDLHGHVVGDLLLIEVARRISRCVREIDIAARFGGDEFVVMLSELNSDQAKSKIQAGMVAEKIRASLAEPFLLQSQQEVSSKICINHNCSSSIGVTLFNGHELNQEEILKQADGMMYIAKEAGRNVVRLYEVDIDYRIGAIQFIK
jgi:diguanylate cyclase (GGDEF)-like protein/PAS domain S-box-containing protein